MKKQKRKVPRLKTERTAEQILGQALFDLDFSEIKRGKVEFEKKESEME